MAKSDKAFDDKLEKLEKQAKQETKKPKKKEIEMKNLKDNSTVKTVTTIILTLVFVAYSLGMIYVGVNWQKQQDETIKSEAVNLSQQMAEVSKPEAVEQ